MNARETERAHARGRGFSLLEMVVVVAVLLVIAALAIPNFMRSKIRANEAAAVGAMRTITTAQIGYMTTYQRGYAASLAVLGPPPPAQQPSAAAAGLIDVVLASGLRNGYNFVYAPIDVDGNSQPEAFTLNANPVSPGQTGEKYFFVDQTNVIRESLGGPANVNSPPVPR